MRLKLHILPVLGAKVLEQVTVADVEKLKVTVSRKGLSAATVRQALALTRRVFNVAEQHGLTSMKNPVTPVRFPKKNNARTRFLSRDEADTLLREARKWNVTLYDTCLIALYTGMRAGEILSLRWSEVDFEHKVITLRDTKNGSTRYAYLTDNVRAALEVRREAQRAGCGGTRHEKSTYSPTGLVFPGEATPKAPHGRVRENMAQQFRRVVKRLGWNDGVTDRRQVVVFHTLRHTFASWLTMDGTPLLVTKELLGHKCIEMTMRYSHLAPSQARAAVERLTSGGSAVSRDAVAH